MEPNPTWEANSRSAAHEFAQHFMKPEGLLSCLKEPVVSRPYHPILLFNINFNIILRPTSRSSYWIFSFWFSHLSLYQIFDF
jgi:hypothetical protein